MFARRVLVPTSGSDAGDMYASRDVLGSGDGLLMLTGARSLDRSAQPPLRPARALAGLPLPLALLRLGAEILDHELDVIARAA